MRYATSSRTCVAMVVVGIGLPCGVAACRTPRSDQTASAAAAAAVQAPPAAMIPHGDHRPHHGGVVLMKGDLHFEVVLDPTGRAHRVYFTDAVREDLPASIASSATVTIKRPNERDEAIPLQIDEAGESWAGTGRAIARAEQVLATVAFTVAGEPYSVDVPVAAAAPPAAEAAR